MTMHLPEYGTLAHEKLWTMKRQAEIAGFRVHVYQRFPKVSWSVEAHQVPLLHDESRLYDPWLLLRTEEDELTANGGAEPVPLYIRELATEQDLDGLQSDVQLCLEQKWLRAVELGKHRRTDAARCPIGSAET
ncbi:unnamed protein product [Amoebophrya sp. A25]|nr:unnamed protein product [Amoebophrya sp. A25]|eukprot:GSA25T00007138001.1